MTSASTTGASPRHPAFGLSMALLTAAAFGTAGTFALGLIGAGWSPAAAVFARAGISALVLLVPTVLIARRRLGVLRRNLSTITVFGLVAVAGSQVAYFNAVQHLSVAVALLIEYMGIVLVVGWLWLRHGQRPRAMTCAGGVTAILGLGLVLNLTGGTTVSLVGVLWALAAAVGLAAYYVMSAQSDPELPPLVMSGGGMLVGAVALGGLGLVGVLPMQWSTADVTLAGANLPWWLPVIGLALIPGALAYSTGVIAARALGSTVSSFVGLTEVLFAVFFAWLALGQLPTTVQLIGGALIVLGVTVVRIGELRATDPIAEPAVPAPAG